MENYNRNVNVIIADDSETFIEGIKVSLSMYEKFNIIETHPNGMSLFNSKRLEEADIILIDIVMPELDGLQVAKLIKQKHPQLPLLAMSMNQQKVYLFDIVVAGFNGFVHKPKAAELLIETIEKVLKNEFVFPYSLK